MLARWRAVGPAGAQRGLLAAVAATLALLGLYRTPVGPRPLPSRPAPPVRGGRGLPHSQQLWHQCRNVLLMSQLQFPWERDDRHQRCKKAQWSVAEALEGVRKLQQSRPDRRAVRIVFIGDSRVRNLHSTLVKELGLRPDNASTVPMFYNEVFHPREQLRRAVPPQPRLPGLRAGCTEVDVMRPDGQDRVRCSLAAGAASLRSEFWWRPYLERRSTALLDSLIAACEAGRCPDLVVIDSGPWYARVARYSGDPTTERVFVFRAELAAAAGRLARLADATRLLWKLDEQYMPEVAYGRKITSPGP
ncbi:hypothetical protein FJT64_012271 [Amphibalanus amphitrite]|uniref:Uncharacterized protein n=1 Tax=Amphibalanus amphitrite TaxID=1232801 RepID=A0A6A4V761_AMPAM|nr:hypothetical protein FJT64_012271 [Amphibalanus amphitrite]